METALHGEDSLAFQFTINQFAFVKFNRGNGEMGNGVVIDDDWVFDFFDEAIAQPRSKDDPYFRLRDAVALNITNRFIDLIEHNKLCTIKNRKRKLKIK